MSLWAPSATPPAVLERLNKAFQRVAVANVYAFNPPPIAGLGNSSGFEFVVQSLAGASPSCCMVTMSSPGR